MNSATYINESDSTWENMVKGVRRMILGYDEQIMMVKVEFQTDAIVPVHSHVHSQCSFIANGVFEFQIGEETQIVKSGDGLYMEPNISHAVKCIESGLIIDTFSPLRKDFLK